MGGSDGVGGLGENRERIKKYKLLVLKTITVM